MNRKLIMVSMLVVCLLALGAVSAADNGTSDIVGADDLTDMLEDDSTVTSSNNNENVLKANE